MPHKWLEKAWASQISTVRILFLFVNAKDTRQRCSTYFSVSSVKSVHEYPPPKSRDKMSQKPNYLVTWVSWRPCRGAFCWTMHPQSPTPVWIGRIIDHSSCSNWHSSSKSYYRSYSIHFTLALVISILKPWSLIWSVTEHLFQVSACPCLHRLHLHILFRPHLIKPRHHQKMTLLLCHLSRLPNRTFFRTMSTVIPMPRSSGRKASNNWNFCWPW